MVGYLAGPSEVLYLFIVIIKFFQLPFNFFHRLNFYIYFLKQVFQSWYSF